MTTDSEAITTALTPQDYGLPAKFTSFRAGQRETIDDIIAERNAGTKLTLLSAPVGSGKSAIGVASGHGKRTLYVCTTKQLQDQIAADFPNAVVLKGRSNYVCLKDPENLTAEHCTKAVGKRNCKWCKYPSGCEGHDDHSYRGPCACVANCEYVQTKTRALAADLAVLNIHLFMTEANFVGGFSGWEYMVVDECDLIESALMSFVDVTLTKRQIEILGLNPPSRKTVEEAWIDWMNKQALPKCGEMIEYLQSEYTTYNIRLQNELENLYRKLKFASYEIPKGNWVFIPDEYRWSFKPVFVSKYAQRYLWDHTKAVMAMSATLVNPRQFCKDLGFDPKDAEMYEIDSTFPVENRLIKYTPKGNVTFKTFDQEFPKVIRGLEDVLAKHPNDKVLVHAVSYGNMRQILETVNEKSRARMIWHEGSKDRLDALERFRNATYPAVLVSPSMDRGIDLPYDACRVIVVMKVPYASLKDKQISSRVYSAADGSEWYATNTIRTIVQATGRATRAADDFSVSYILDGQFGRLYGEHKMIFPKWWREALVMEGV